MTGELSECRSELPRLIDNLARLDIRLSPVQTELLVRYCALLMRRNREVNLTGIRTPAGIMTTLFLDSCTILPALPAEWRSRPLQACDVGAGAGIPGFPLKIACPTWQLTAIESIAKKARFLAEVVATLPLERTRVAAERVETLGMTGRLRCVMDLCTARAVGSLPVLLEWCAPLVKIGGLLVFPRSGKVEADVTAAEQAASVLRTALIDVHAVPEVIGLGHDRAIVVYEKRGETPDRFPRRIGLARERPISGLSN